MRSESRRDDGYPLPRFGKSEQGMRAAAFEQNVRREPRKAACGVEGSAKPEPAIQQEQWIRREAPDLDCAAAAERQQWMARGEQLSRVQRLASEAVVQLNRVRQHLAKVYIAP